MKRGPKDKSKNSKTKSEVRNVETINKIEILFQRERKKESTQR